MKLLKEIGVKDTNLISDAPLSHPLGDWYANLLWINRRKCVLFINEATLYAFLVYGIKKTDLKDFRGLFVSHLKQNLESEGFGNEVIGKVLKEYDEIGLGRTQNRSVLGSMNDYANQYWCHLMEYADVSDFDIEN